MFFNSTLISLTLILFAACATVGADIVAPRLFMSSLACTPFLKRRQRNFGLAHTASTSSDLLQVFF